jgi:hypothetical protein
MWELTADIAPSEVASWRMSRDSEQNVVYLELERG